MRPDYSKPILVYQTRIPAEWADYNGHMNQARYLQCFDEATDELFRIIGVDQEYVAAGNSYFTVETHICHLAEAVVGDEVSTFTQLIDGTGKKLHVFHFLYGRDETLLATGEQMMLHVSLETRRACEPLPQVQSRLAEIAACHDDLPKPPQLGRHVGDRG